MEASGIHPGHGLKYTKSVTNSEPPHLLFLLPSTLFPPSPLHSQGLHCPSSLRLTTSSRKPSLTTST